MLENIPTKLISDSFNNTYLLVGSDLENLISTAEELIKTICIKIKGEELTLSKLDAHKVFIQNAKDRTECLGFVSYSYSFTDEGTITCAILRINIDAKKKRLEALIQNGEDISKKHPTRFSNLTNNNNKVLVDTYRLKYINTCIHETVHWVQTLYLSTSGTLPNGKFPTRKNQLCTTSAITSLVKKWISEIVKVLILPLYDGVPKEQWISWKDNPVSICYEVHSDSDVDQFIITNSSINTGSKTAIWANSCGNLILSSIDTLGVLFTGDIDNYHDSFSYLVDAISDLFFEVLLHGVQHTERRLESYWASDEGREVSAYYVANVFVEHYKYLEKILLDTNVIKLK